MTISHSRRNQQRVRLIGMYRFQCYNFIWFHFITKLHVEERYCVLETHVITTRSSLGRKRDLQHGSYCSYRKVYHCDIHGQFDQCKSFQHGAKLKRIRNLNKRFSKFNPAKLSALMQKVRYYSVSNDLKIRCSYSPGFFQCNTNVTQLTRGVIIFRRYSSEL